MRRGVEEPPCSWHIVEREASKNVSIMVGIGVAASFLCLVAAVLSSMHKMTVREAREAGRETVVPDDDVSSLLTPRGAGPAAGREFPSGARVTRDAACE